MIIKKLEDGSAWPIPGDDMEALAYRLRYPGPGKEPEYYAASIIEAYMTIVRSQVVRRNRKIAMIRRAAR